MNQPTEPAQGRQTARQRVRALIQSEILDVAHQQMTQVGAGQISLRAISRELAMASSAIHRYFPTRDDVITGLLLREFNALGQAMRTHQDKLDPDDLTGRFKAVLISGRAWALANPHSWALLYGTPVPGYVAPEATKEPAAAPMRLLAELLAKVDQATLEASPPAAIEVPKQTLAPALTQLPDVPTHLVAAALAAWTWMVGAVGVELWGHYEGVLADPDGFFAATLDHWAVTMGLPGAA